MSFTVGGNDMKSVLDVMKNASKNSKTCEKIASLTAGMEPGKAPYSTTIRPKQNSIKSGSLKTRPGDQTPLAPTITVTDPPESQTPDIQAPGSQTPDTQAPGSQAPESQTPEGPTLKIPESGDKTGYIDTSRLVGKLSEGRDSNPASPDGRSEERTGEEEGRASGRRRSEDERGTDVASKVSSKYLNKFIDYYNEALRKRLIRQLEESVRNTKVIELDFDSMSDSEDEAPPTMSVWGVPLKPDKKEEEKRGKWKKAFVPLRKKSTAAEQQRLQRRLAVLARFRKKAKIIIFCNRCIKEHCFKFRERSELTPYITALNYIDYHQEHVKDLMFDRSQFRAAKKMRFPEEAKRVLSMNKPDRTEQERYSAQIALRNIKGFAVLPARMQEMIAKCGQYEDYESRRVITREGHPPSAFYFILSGTVVAMKYDEEKGVAVTVDEYIRGDCFEENAMVNDSPREVTILTKEPCEFMSISANDYKNIFMQGGVHNLNDPDQDKFMRSLKFLEGWPIKLLQDHPSECRFHYFKRGAILSDDTHKNLWLIIVKSGSLSVLKKLKKVGPYEWKKNAGIKPLTEKEQRLRKHQKEQWRRIVLPDLRLPLRKGSEIEQIEERVDGRPKPFQHPNLKVQNDDSGDKENKIYYPNYWAIKHGVGDTENDDKQPKSFTSINKQFLYLMSSANDTSKGREVKSAGKAKDRTVRNNQPERPKTVHPKDLEPTTSASSPAPSERSDMTLGSLSGIESPEMLTPRTPTSVFEERLKQIQSSNISDIDVNPQFVTIQTLVKGDVWGLADLILEDQPSFMVVSNGADCVLLNKSFYMGNCSEKLGRRLEQDLCPYPSDDSLQDNLQTSVDWNDYRKRLLSSTMDDIRMRRRMRETVFEARPQELF